MNQAQVLTATDLMAFALENGGRNEAGLNLVETDKAIDRIAATTNSSAANVRNALFIDLLRGGSSAKRLIDVNIVWPDTEGEAVSMAGVTFYGHFFANGKIVLRHVAVPYQKEVIKLFGEMKAFTAEDKLRNNLVALYGKDVFHLVNHADIKAAQSILSEVENDLEPY